MILDHGAEVLKFMGDGLLAIFAIADNETEACKRALAAARQAQSNIAALASSAMPGSRFGLALHIGDVLYGNIGSGNRLDFTCIGPELLSRFQFDKPHRRPRRRLGDRFRVTVIDDAALHQHGAELIDQRGALCDKPVAGTVKHLHVAFFCAFT